MININDNIIIQRTAEKRIRHFLEPNKVVVVLGPRRSGKTTLLRQIQVSLDQQEKILWLDGELDITKQKLAAKSVTSLKGLVGSHTLVIIDEAQAVPDIGNILKLIVDHLPGIKVIASGSATFDLASQVGEPLVGRKWSVWVYPLQAVELRNHFPALWLEENIENLLIYGSYPQLQHISSMEDKSQYLEELISTSLYRDILELDSVRNSAKIRGLLQMLALQVGQEVSRHELATALEMGTVTVERYLDLLEQAFVIVRIGGFSRNLRKEIRSSARYYFVDNGVRNALLRNFNPLSLRGDVGALWENWLAMERIKKQKMESPLANNYFWRTYDQKEIDWVEERDGKLYGYEFSWQFKEIRKATRKEFTTAYPNSELTVIHQGNYQDFIL